MERSLANFTTEKKQEPRITTAYCQEPALIQNWIDNRDIYATMASEFYKKPYDECNKNPDGSDTKERKVFKMVNLAISYGMSPQGLGGALGISEQEATDLINNFYKKFPKFAAFIRENTKNACEKGYVEIQVGGYTRYRRLPHLKGRDPSKVYDTQSTNARVQGGAAIQSKIAMIVGDKLCKKLSSPGRKFALLCCIHDEILYLLPEDVTREEVRLFERVMEESVQLKNVASGTDGAIGKNWGNLVEVDRFEYKK